MKLSVEGQLRRAVWGLCAVGSVGAAISSPAALAQQSGDATQLKGVEVTGSRIRRVDTETSNLVQTLDRKQIEATGATTLGELIQAIPSVTGAPLSATANNNGGSITGGGGSYGGGGSVDIRGLGPKRTLLLLDGQRLNNNDPDAIPANMIERIEVLKEGAGSTYGTDAIGGVVNFISRKNFSGLEAVGQFGKTQRNDGQTTGASITWGSSGAKYKAVFGLNYNDQREIRATSRYATANPAGLAYGAITNGAFSSSRAPGGRFTLPGTSPTAIALDCNGKHDGSAASVTLKAGATGTSPSDYRCFVNNFGAGGDRFNYQPYNLDLDPSRRESLFGTGSYKFNDSVSWYGQGFFAHTQSTRKLAPEPFDISTIAGIFPTLGAPVISKDNIYNPFGVDITSYAKRSVDAGARELDYNVDQWQATTGLKGVLFDRFQWDLAYNYGRLDLSNPNRGYLDFSKVFQQLGPSFIDAQGVATCGTVANPILNCTPVNIFGTTGNTLAGLSTVVNDVTVQDEQDFTFNVSGDLFNLPAGAVGVAAGAEYRSLHLDSIADGLQQEYQLSEANFKETSGGYNVREAYAEAEIPLVKDLPGVKSFMLNVGVRYSDFSSFGSNVAGKYAFEYRPIDDLMLRATYSDTFRAPTTGELFGGATQSAPAYTDPCLDSSGVATAGTIAGHNKACNGVAIGSTQPNTQGNGNAIGNPNLKPEKGYSTDFGLVLNPSIYKPLTITLDYYHYTLKQAISSISLNEVLNACYASDSSAYCGTAPDGTPYFTRVNDSSNPAAPTTSIANATLPSLNSFSLYQNGWDGEVKLDYRNVRVAGNDIGNFDFGVNLTYINKFEVKVFDPASGELVDDASVAGTYDFADTGVVAPRFKGLGFLFWSLGPVAVSVEDRYIGNLKMNHDDLSGPPSPTAGAPYNSGYANYVDLAGTYTVKPINTSFTVGINDLFDDGIQRTFDSTSAGAPNPVYDVRGRNFYGKVTVRFK